MPPDPPTRRPPPAGAPELRKKPCPICGRPAAADTHPFCSVRCRQVDLGRWLSGSYVIPARDDEEDGDRD
ncbi:MAG: DNA gyrase inhibitor YacG [Xanthobacteraceae bacterium]|nr:DNA gyrase inhibitor YacG [Xanthobacteraceae bacterium]